MKCLKSVCYKSFSLVDRSDSVLRSEYLQYHEGGVVPCLNTFHEKVKWYKISGSRTERIDPCNNENTHQVCESAAPSNQGGFDLTFLNVTMKDNNSTYYCTQAKKLIQIFVKAPETDPEIQSLTPGLNKQRKYTKRDADYYFGNTSQPMIQMKCGVSIKTRRQFTLNWTHTTTNRQIAVLTSEKIPPDDNSFSREPQSWLRSTDKWLDLYLPVHKLKTVSGVYTCYVHSADFYQQSVPVSRVAIRL